MINNKIFISGGGTGGHLFPALTIGNELKKAGYDILYIGSKYGIESKYFLEKNISSFELLDIYGINRQLTLYGIFRNLLFPIKFINSYFKSRMLIKKLKPKIIIGTGGYSSGLPLLAAIHLGVPTLIQDQNSIPGLITNKLQNKITKICTAYKDFPLKDSINNIVMTGNPIRTNLIPIDRNNAIEKLQLEVDKKTILILGGSQGSQPINAHIINNINFYLDNNYQIIWQCGEKNYNYIPNSIINHKNILVDKFFDNMSLIYSAADLTISRAGALAISELLFMKKAFILIPFQYAANQHQDINATYIEKENACIKIKESKLKSGILERRISEILESNEKLEELEMNASRIRKPNATKEIIEEIEKIIS